MSVIAGESVALFCGQWVKAHVLRGPNESGRICVKWNARGIRPTVLDVDPAMIPDHVCGIVELVSDAVEHHVRDPIEDQPFSYLTLAEFAAEFPGVELPEI